MLAKLTQTGKLKVQFRIHVYRLFIKGCFGHQQKLITSLTEIKSCYFEHSLLGIVHVTRGSKLSGVCNNKS